MGLSSGKPFHAGNRDAADRGHDPRQAASERAAASRYIRGGLIGLLAWGLACAASAETLRIATYNVELTRKGPGLLLRDILRGKDPQVAAVASVIATTSPDILVLTGIDFDLGLAALTALADRIATLGKPYPYRFALRPNTGMGTGLDLDGNGRRGEARDAQGFGRFSGEGGMAILSRLPIETGSARDYSAFLWRDLPGNLLSGAQLTPEAEAIQRLSSTAHWDVPVTLPDGRALHLLAWHATPPVFDGPEDRNGRRNHDEAAFWLRLLEGALPFPRPEGAFVLLGDANLDPVDGDGRPAAITALMQHPMLQDPAPGSAGGAQTSGQSGNPALHTADFTARNGPGGLRVDYLLPSAALAVQASGVFWPPEGDPLRATVETASRHRMVWADISLP